MEEYVEMNSLELKSYSFFQKAKSRHKKIVLKIIINKVKAKTAEYEELKVNKQKDRDIRNLASLAEKKANAYRNIAKLDSAKSWMIYRMLDLLIKTNLNQ